jgi:hypothetical protein
MLINFCDSDQLIAAIDITSKTLSIFFRQHTAVESDAFCSFLEVGFQQYSFSMDVVYKDRNHIVKFHKITSHLENMDHMHFRFDASISMEIMKTFIALLQLYQKDDNSIRKVKEGNQYNFIANSDAQKGRIEYVKLLYGEAKEYYSKSIITQANIFKLWEEFTNFAPKPSYNFSSRDILNYFNHGLERQEIKSHGYHHIQLELPAKTCANINNLATRYSYLDNQYASTPPDSAGQYSECAVAGLATVALLFVGLSFFRRWHAKPREEKRGQASTYKNWGRPDKQTSPLSYCIT